MSTPPTRARVYRNIELRTHLLGLEPFDAIALGALAWLLMLMNRGGVAWNVLALVLAYAGLRVAKRGKPEGYTTTLLRYYLRRPFYSAAAADRKLHGHPFIVVTDGPHNPHRDNPDPRRSP